MHSLVVSNKKIMENSVQFQEISVTAEKWLPIEEVNENQLLQFLQEKKQEGWSLLGVEQTSNSKMLQNYTFPPKSVLLLGKTSARRF